MAKTKTSTKGSSTVKEKKATGTGSKKPTVTKTKKTTTKKSTKTSTKKAVKETEVEVEEEDVIETAAKRQARKDAAVTKAKKSPKPLNATEMANSIADIVSNAYNLTKPKGKDISVADPEKLTISRIPVSLKTNWGQHCHEYQIKMFVDCFAHKMQYEVRNFQLRPDAVIFELYGPFPEIKEEV